MGMISLSANDIEVLLTCENPDNRSGGRRVSCVPRSLAAAPVTFVVRPGALSSRTSQRGVMSSYEAGSSPQRMCLSTGYTGMLTEFRHLIVRPRHACH